MFAAKANQALFCLFAMMLGFATSSCVSRVEADDTSATTAVPTSHTAAVHHPLDPVIGYARQGLVAIDRHIDDYTCRLVKRERIAGRLSNYQFMNLKIRHAERNEEGEIPFGVYLKFDKPSTVQGREVLFVEGQRGGDILVRRGGKRLPNMTLQLDPAGDLAMKEHRYPITDVGVRNLVIKLIEVMEKDRAYSECEVKVFKGAKLNGRSCTHIQVVHPVKRAHFRYNVARVFIDDELQVPVYYAAYDWPKSNDTTPVLMEEYMYTDFTMNVGLTDKDFDRSNPSYGFRKVDELAAR